ncbi:hypothetical protein AX14_013300 [Amanita brunnescens Koide BX004]|nr:hypothetical protein AX14_013300 [Amanita brunnescens Koide BX004]
MRTRTFHPALSRPWINFVQSLKLLRRAFNPLYWRWGFVTNVHQHVTFSKVDALVLLQVNIKSGLLFLVPETRASAEERGLAEIEGKALSMGILKELIELVRRHMTVVTEAGCRVLISLILLRVASTMSTDQMDVNIIPEYPISRTLFPGNRSFGGAVDFLLTKLPGRYTRYLLGDPTTALGNPDAIKGPVTSYIFEAKRDNVRATIPRAVIAAASYSYRSLEVV